MWPYSLCGIFLGRITRLPVRPSVRPYVRLSRMGRVCVSLVKSRTGFSFTVFLLTYVLTISLGLKPSGAVRQLTCKLYANILAIWQVTAEYWVS